MPRPTRIYIVDEQPTFPTIAAPQSADRLRQIGAIKSKRFERPYIRCQAPFRST
jgi:hypothetical protein